VPEGFRGQKASAWQLPAPFSEGYVVLARAALCRGREQQGMMGPGFPRTLPGTALEGLQQRLPGVRAAPPHDKRGW